MPIRPKTFQLKQSQGERRPGERWRGTAAERGYDHTWNKLRASVLQEQPLCQDCEDHGITNPDDLELDHIIPITERPDLRLVRANLRMRCKACHQRKTNMDEKRQWTSEEWQRRQDVLRQIAVETG